MKYVFVESNKNFHVHIIIVNLLPTCFGLKIHDITGEIMIVIHNNYYILL